MSEGEFGFTFSYRKKWQHPAFRNLLEAGIWAWMCDSAVWEPEGKVIRFNNTDVFLERGQLVTSAKFIESGFGVTRQAFRTFLSKLEKNNMINQLSNQRRTIITICNYNKYQPIKEDGNQLTNQLVEGNEQTNQLINQLINQPDVNVSSCNTVESSTLDSNANQLNNQLSNHNNNNTNKGVYLTPNTNIENTEVILYGVDKSQPIVEKQANPVNGFVTAEECWQDVQGRWHFRQSVMERAKRKCQGLDVHDLLAQWQGWIVDKPQPPSDPIGSFIGFCKKKMRQASKKNGGSDAGGNTAPARQDGEWVRSTESVRQMAEKVATDFMSKNPLARRVSGDAKRHSLQQAVVEIACLQAQLLTGDYSHSVTFENIPGMPEDTQRRDAFIQQQYGFARARQGIHVQLPQFLLESFNLKSSKGALCG